MSLVSFGEILIDFVSQQHGVTVGDAPGFTKAPGGGTANVAVAAARLGVDTAFMGQVGDDPFGHHLAEVLEAEGIDVRGLRFSTEARTMLAFVSLTQEGERSFVFFRHPGADMLMRPEDVALEVLDGRKAFHFSSITMIHEPSRSATLYAVRAARARGMLISYDPNLRLSLWPDAETARTGILAGLDFVHVLKVSDEEVEFLTGGSDIAPLWRPDMRLIAVTRGARGATLHTRATSVEGKGFSVRPLDTTGAGDGFMAGLLCGILERGDTYEAHLPEIVRFANAVGAITTTQLGAIPTLPTRAAVEAFLKERQG
jgi:fructokinase